MVGWLVGWSGSRLVGLPGFMTSVIKDLSYVLSGTSVNTVCKECVQVTRKEGLTEQQRLFNSELKNCICVFKLKRV